MQPRPLQGRVLIRRVSPKGKTGGRIFIPDTALEKPMEGDAVAVGPGVRAGTAILGVLDPAVSEQQAA